MSAVLKATPTNTNPTVATVFPPLSESEVIVVRPSDITDMDSCSFKHGLRRVGVKPLFTRSNLVFGTIMHRVVEMHVTDQVTESELPGFFEQEWNQARQQYVIRYSSNETFDSLTSIGKSLAARFPSWWKLSGFRAFRFPNGEPSVEQRLTKQLSPTVILSTQPDLVVECTRTIMAGSHVMAVPGDIAILDLKTPKAASAIEFCHRSAQLTYAKIAVDANKAKTGLSKDVERVGYLEFLKKKTPEIVPPFLYERPAHLVSDAIRKALYAADRIRRGEYVRESGMAFNSPCRICDVAGACLSGDDSDLEFPDGLTAAQLMR